MQRVEQEFAFGGLSGGLKRERRHCEERSDEANQGAKESHGPLDCFAACAMTDARSQ